MYTQTYTIGQEAILTKVRLHADYVGDRRGQQTFDRISLEPESDEILEPILEGAMSEVDRTLKQYVQELSFANKIYTLTLSLPTSTDYNINALQYAIEHYLVYSVLAGWYDVVSPQDSEVTRAKAATYMDRVKEIAYWRERPGKANITPEDAPWQDIEIEGTDSSTTTTSTSDTSTSTATDGTATETSTTE